MTKSIFQAVVDSMLCMALCRTGDVVAENVFRMSGFWELSVTVSEVFFYFFLSEFYYLIL